MTEADIFHAAIWFAGLSASALCGLIVWNARTMISEFGDMRDGIEKLRNTIYDEMRGFDRRLTRLETVVKMHSEDGDD